MGGGRLSLPKSAVFGSCLDAVDMSQQLCRGMGAEAEKKPAEVDFSYCASKSMNNDAHIGQTRECLTPASRMAFGKQHRLEIAAVITAIGPPVWSRQLAETLGIADNQVAADLRHFSKWRALEPFPAPHDRRKLYVAVPHPVWRYARELFERAVMESFPDDGRERIDGYWRRILDDGAPAAIPEASA